MKIVLNNITKIYEIPGSQNQREVLKNISLTVNPADSIAIVGPSGSGKSTLLNILGTLDRPSSGNVLFDDKELYSMNENQLAHIRNNNIGFVFQVHHLLPQLTLLENVLVPVIPQKDKMKRKLAKAKAMELIEFVGLTDKITQRPGQMSVGECQRTAVVRALINEPEILLADEPTGSLDQETAEQLGELLQEINSKQNIATVVVTHSEKLAKKMSRIYKLINGELRE
ncbi:MAG: ABC transporter ATP-binding protein [Bacteroidetes bacterium]|nr:ABC transporter ATP-binding protein [Bacteroidota bacterium]MBL7104163.1 ABC transporter ATP-binding protein [Bacteroidales bacterium]